MIIILCEKTGRHRDMTYIGLPVPGTTVKLCKATRYIPVDDMTAGEIRRPGQWWNSRQRAHSLSKTPARWCAAKRRILSECLRGRCTTSQSVTCRLPRCQRAPHLAHCTACGAYEPALSCPLPLGLRSTVAASTAVVASTPAANSAALTSSVLRNSAGCATTRSACPETTQRLF